MSFTFIYFYRKLLSKDATLLNRARLRILFTCIVSLLFLMFILTVVYFISSRYILLCRAAFFGVMFAISFYLFMVHKHWKAAAHFFLTCVTLLIWTNVLLVHQSLYVINVQYCLLLIAASYYVLGPKNGIRYGIAGILPILADFFLSDFLQLGIPSRMVDVNFTAYAIATVINFILILYIHHLFFKSLTRFKIRELFFKRRLERALSVSQEQELAKTNFVNTMSHEIRTPLNAIVGMSNLLLSGNKLSEQEENLQVLYFSAQSLMGTVNEIIDFNNLSNDQIILKKEAFYVFKAINSVCATFKTHAMQKSLKFDCRIDEKLKDVLVMGDELRLSQILFQLIGNAIKFTNEGFVLVQVTASQGQTEGIQIDFHIEDSGIGISKAKQRQLFDPFKKELPRSQRQYQATLGLTITYQLLALHQSELNISSKAGKGSYFDFSIVYALAAAREEPETVKAIMPAADLSKLRLLAVDDEKLNLMVIKKTLAKWHIKVDEAVNGKIALERCMEQDYDVVLMDINMPVMDGFEASQAIKAINRKNFVPPYIIALTASVGAAIENVTRLPWIDSCILKPFKPDELKKALEEVMQTNYAYSYQQES